MNNESDIVDEYEVFLCRKDLDRFLTLAQNFNKWFSMENIPRDRQCVVYHLKMHESELLLLKLSIEDISILPVVYSI